MNIEIPDIALEITEHCKNCSWGKIQIPDGLTPKGRQKKKTIECSVCNGKAYVSRPSAFGYDLLDFLNKYRDSF